MCNAWKEEAVKLRAENEQLKEYITELEKPELPAQELPSPHGIMSWIEVKRYPDRIEIAGEWEIAHVADSNSMEPIFDIGHVLMVRPPRDNEAANLKAGDIAIYTVDEAKQIFHAVKEANRDERGVYYTFEGINNIGYPDPYKVRPMDIVYLIGGWFNTYY